MAPKFLTESFLDKKENLMLQMRYLSWEEFIEIENSSDLIQRLFIDLSNESEISLEKKLIKNGK